MTQKQSARKASTATKPQSARAEAHGWSELWQKEDWWAIWLGLGLVIAAIIAYLAGGTIKPIAIKPAAWDSFAALRDHFAAQYGWYLLPVSALGRGPRYQRLGNGLEARGVPPVFPLRLCGVANHFRDRPVERGRRLQSRTAARCPGSRPHCLEPSVASGLDGCGLPG